MPEPFGNGEPSAFDKSLEWSLEWSLRLLEAGEARLVM